jgi:signal peptidase
MKRGIILAILVVIVIIGIYSVKEWMPVMAIAGDSMKPELNQGDAILIGSVEASEVKVGDVIVFSVHPLIQENYRYPAVVAHRVTELTTFQSELAFKTKGDNTTEDPFVVPAADLRGEVSGSVPYLGYILLFLQSRQGMIFAIIALVLIGIELYAKDLKRGGQKLQNSLFAPFVKQNQEIVKSQQETSRMTSEALQKFATAMSEYAEHLASHTSAIRGLSDASQELKRGAAEQNRVLSAIMENIGEPDIKQDTIITREATPATSKQVTTIKKTTESIGKYHKALSYGTPGCARKKPPTLEEISSISH